MKRRTFLLLGVLAALLAFQLGYMVGRSAPQGPVPLPAAGPPTPDGWLDA